MKKEKGHKGGDIMENRYFPIGIENFEEMVKDNYYYVDKTELISNLIRNKAKTNFCTFPRRFGKTLTMSMLRYFFEIGTDKSLFDNLAISNEKELCEQYMGMYPVISISLKEVDGLSFKSAYDQLRSIIQKEAFRLMLFSTYRTSTSSNYAL